MSVYSRIAWRDLRAAALRALLIIVAMAVSVAAISGVRSATEAARSALFRDSREWLAADVSVTTGDWLDEDQLAALDHIGSDWTPVTWVLTMAASDQAPDPGFISVKAIDPSKYPFYGAIDLVPPQTLAAALRVDTVVVSADVLEQLHLQIGDVVRIGGQSFRIAAVIKTEPDRFAGAPGLGMRAILSRDGFLRSGIERAGNAVRHRILLRLAAESGLARARGRLQELVPEGSVLDYRDAGQQATWTVETTISFLNVIAFITLALGTLGVAIAVRQHVEQRMHTVAVMRTVGARSSQIASVFLFQIAWMMGAAVVIGLPLGLAVRAAILSLAGNYVLLPAVAAWHTGALLESAGTGVITMAASLVQPWLVIRRMRPGLLLRRDTQEKHLASGTRSGVYGAAAAGLACAGYGVAALTMLGSWSSASFLVSALAASVGIVSVGVAIVLRGLRWLVNAGPVRTIPVLRHGLAGLYRDGNQAHILIVAVAIGMMMIIATFEVKESVARSIVQALPFGEANFFIAGFDDQHRESVRSFLASQPGVQGPVEIVSLARLRLVSVNGTPLEKLQKDHTIVETWYVGCTSAPSHSAANNEGWADLGVADDVAKSLHLSVGSRVEFAARDKIIRSKVSSIRGMTPVEKVWHSLTITCDGLNTRSLFHHAAARVQPARVAAVRRAAHAQYPSFGVVTDEDIATTIRGVSDDAMTLARIVAWYAIGSGVAVLMAIVSASRPLRLREIGVLSALGARRITIIKIYTLEFAAIGVLSGIIGSVLACGFTSVILSAVFHRAELAIEWKGTACAIVLSALMAIGAGWIPVYHLLRRKPLDILRAE